jgi:hypothetical protein
MKDEKMEKAEGWAKTYTPDWGVALVLNGSALMFAEEVLKRFPPPENGDGDFRKKYPDQFIGMGAQDTTWQPIGHSSYRGLCTKGRPMPYQNRRTGKLGFWMRTDDGPVELYPPMHVTGVWWETPLLTRQVHVILHDDKEPEFFTVLGEDGRRLPV